MTVAVNELELAWSLLGQQRYEEAIGRAAAVLRRFPDNVSALACHAMASWKAGSDAQAPLAEMERAVALAPDVASLRHNLATLLASLGSFEASATQFLEALRIKPDDTLAFYGLTQNKKFTARDPLIDSMQALYDGGALDPQLREFLAFGLAKAYDDLGDADRAMPLAMEANRLGERPFELAAEGAALEELASLARLDAFRRARPSGNSSRAPLFIVGMNRSGTTLVESILSRHPDVVAQGEMGEIVAIENAAYRQCGPAARRIGRHELMLALDQEWMSLQAERLLKRASARTTEPFKVLTDKLPENAVRLGLIARLFPNARVVHVRRHPLDAGISNFFQRFSVGQGYSFRLDWIGARTRQIADSMAIWKRAIDLPILDVSYEQLVADPAGQSRRLIGFAGLDWTDDCLEPALTQRSVMTASQWQVRQPINRGSVDRWRRYERWLSPMVEAMGGMEWVEREAADVLGKGR